MSAILRKIELRRCLAAFFASALLAFGLYNVHAAADITEGGVLGMTLLLERWFSVSPAVSGFVMNALCYAAAFRMFGYTFLVYSASSVAGFSIAYTVFEQFPPLWSGLSQMPLLAAVLGALFVGVSVGICVRAGAASGGDDALAMVLSRRLHVGIEWIYLTFDLVVLLLSLTYIPLRRIAYSILTVVLSGQIIGLIERMPSKK
ncbi:MAG: YitT family protein [Oscillospiraceae bacterium]|nr:YitT family protein [Oscillospiraceae bacterium]